MTKVEKADIYMSSIGQVKRLTSQSRHHSFLVDTFFKFSLQSPAVSLTIFLVITSLSEPCHLTSTFTSQPIQKVEPLVRCT